MLRVPDKKRTRQTAFWELHDFSVGRGLEIGPLHRTMVSRDVADVRYLDVQDRDALVAHYAADAGVDTDLIPDIDYALIQPDGRTVGLVEATAAGAPFAWVVASHVIEHVPDLIGWLEEIAEITEDGAALLLVVPDRRYCFDVNRPPTTVGQLLQAHQDRDTRPSIRAVYDYLSSVVDNDARALWRGDTPGYDRRLHTLQEAQEKVADTLEGTYVDCHVWLFTPQSFVEQLHELRITGRSAWMVERVVPTAVHDVEFTAVLRRLPRGADTTSTQAGEVLPTENRPDWLIAPVRSEMADALEARIEALEAQLQERREKLRKVRAELRDERARREASDDAPRRDAAASRDRTPVPLWVRRVARKVRSRVHQA